MRERVLSLKTILACSMLIALTLTFLNPSLPSAQADNKQGYPRITAVTADDNLVNRWGDNVKITFQVRDENGSGNIESVTIEIMDSDGIVQKSENAPPRDNIKLVRTSTYTKVYSYGFNPENSFPVGYADVKIYASDKENHENSSTEQELFQITDKKASVKTDSAENITENSATLNSSIDLAGYDKVEARFYYENGTGHNTLDNQTNWENTSSSHFEKTIKNLKPKENYEFRASIRLPSGLPDPAKGSDNGSVQSFTTLTDKKPASVKTQSATEVKNGRATLNSSISYGDYDNVDIRFRYRVEGGSWQSTGWKENYRQDDYSKRVSVETGRVYEFYSEIRFDSDNRFDNGSILTFQSGGVEIYSEYPTHIQVNPSGMEDRFIIFTINNYFQGKQLRNVIIEVTGEKPDTGFRVFRDTHHSVGIIQPDSSSSENIAYQPMNSGEKKLEFTISYRVYEDNDFIYYKEREISISILVSGTEYDNAIDLQVSTQTPPREWIYDGESYNAQIIVQNQRPTEVSGIRLVNEKGRDVGVGSLEPNASTTVTVRVPPENYNLGEGNKVKLKATHEFGVSPPLNLQFGVRPENSPVGVYLVNTNSPIYQGSKLKFTLVVAGSGDSSAEDLTIRCLSDNVIPQGYWIGEEMKNLTQQQVSTEQIQRAMGVESLLGGAAPSGAEAESGGEEQGKNEERAIVGRRIYFEARNLDYDDNSIKFEMTYELGDRLISREFEVDFKIHHTPEVMLIQSEPVSAMEGSTATISLEIANEMDQEVKAVRVLPQENIEVTPRPVYWIGPMGPDEFLPVEFNVDTSGLEDGENLSFQPVYRVGDKSVTGSSISVSVNIKESKEAPIKYYAAASAAVVVVLLLVFWYRR